MSRGPRADTGRGPTGYGPTSASTADVDESLKTRTMDEAPVGITVADATAPDMPLVYVNAAFEQITGYPPEYAVGRNCRFLQGEGTRDEPVARMRAAIENGSATSVELRNYRRDGELFWNEVTIAPLRDDEGQVTHYVGFQQDVTRRKRAELAAARRAARIEQERAAQEHLLERLDGVVADVTETVTRSASRTALERGVVESVDGTYAGAWIGRYDPASDEVSPTVATDVADSVTSRRIGTDADGAVASVVTGALRDRQVHVTRTDADGVRGMAAVAGVPLYYGDATYGTLCVYSRDVDGFDDHERAVLAALGRTVATGINAHENQRTLRADDAVELRFSVGAEHPLVALVSALDCRMTYAGSVGDRDRPARLFELDADPDAVRAAAAEAAVDLHAVLVEGADGCLVELSVADGAFRDLLADHGATLRDATVERHAGRFTVEVGQESLARSMAEAVMARYENGDLVGYREGERRHETRGEFVERLRDNLTDRQHAALVRAHTSGFFEWPHETSGDDIAEAMGVCRSTFHQHLRAAERKLVRAVLDG